MSLIAQTNAFFIAAMASTLWLALLLATTALISPAVSYNLLYGYTPAELSAFIANTVYTLLSLALSFFLHL